MVEVGSAVTGDDFADEAHFIAHLGFEGTYILGALELGQFGRRELMPLHVQDGGGAKLAGGEALVEGEGLADLLHHFGRDGLAGFPVVGIVGQDFRDKGEVLVELGEHLHEVAGHVGAAHGHVVALAQEAVESVAELMEGRLHVVDGEEAGLGLGGIHAGGREVADVHDDGTDTRLLLAEVVHPGTTTLGGTHEVVAVEDADEGAVGVGNLVSLGGVVIHFHLAGHFLEVETVDLFGGGKNALQHAVGLEVRLGLALVQGIFLGAQALGIIAPVPGLDLVARNLLHFLHLLVGAADGGIHDGLQEVVHGLGGTGHLVGKLVGGEVGIAQEFGQFGAEAQGLQHDGVVVVFIAVIAAGGIRQEHLFALLTVLAGAHEIVILAHGDAGLLLEGVILGQQILAEFLAQGGQAGADLSEALLGLGLQAHAVADEAFVDLLHHHLLLAGKAGGILINGLHAGEEVFVHHDFVGSIGDERSHFFFDGLHLGRGIALGQVEKDALHLVQDGAGVLVSQDGILEGRGVGVLHDGLDVGLLFGQAGLEGGHVLVRGNLGEGGRSVRGVPLLQENVLGLFVTGTKHSHGCKYY